MKKYKILIISDNEDLEKIPLEDLKKEFKEVDFIMAAGDLRDNYLDYLFTVLNKELLYVRGNHDTIPEGKIPFCRNVDGKVIKFKGLNILGLGGSKPYSYGENQYTDGDMFLRVIKIIWEILFREIDIVISHAPPRGIHDKENYIHQGYEIFNKIIKYFKPLLWIHGHVHLPNSRYIQESIVGETRVVNAYGYKIIEFYKK